MNRLGLRDIEDAEIISESTLSDSNGSFIRFMARQVDRFTGDNRGSWITEGLVLADLAENKDQLRGTYRANKAAIDQYFSHVDVEKLMNEIGPGVQQQIKTAMTERVKNNIPGFLAGTLVTAGIIAAMKYKKKNR